MRGYILLLILVFLVGHVTSYGCGPCTCTEDENSMLHTNCSDKGLTSVPHDLPTSTRFLNLSNNLIAPDNLNSICEYTLLTLDLSRNHLTSLSSRQFIKCYIGESIDFADNVLEEVSDASLVGLQNVRKISNLESLYYHPGSLSTLVSLVELSIVIHQSNITGNMFANLDRLQDVSVDIRGARHIPENLFQPISSTVRKLRIITESLSVITINILRDCSVLEEFILLGRNLFSIPDTLFRTTPEVRTICMRGVGSLPRYIFDDLDKLETLELHEVEDMPSDLFAGLITLKTLDLSECSFSTIPLGWFEDLLSLERLDLEYVGLRFLTADDFIGLEKLSRIELSNNRLRSLDAFSFDHIQSTVRYIGLHANELKVIDEDIFTDLTQLETLDMSSNKIHSISEKAFESLPELKDLNLHDNKIYVLNEGVFENNEMLEVLDLSSNVISETETSVFDHLQSLRMLNVSDNRLKNITHVIGSLTPSVRILDLSLNHLECMCVPTQLMTVLENVTVLGTCKMTDDSIEELSLQSFIHSEVCLPRPTTTTSTHPVTSPAVASTPVTNTPRSHTKPTRQQTNKEQNNTNLTGGTDNIHLQPDIAVEDWYSNQTNHSSEYGTETKPTVQNKPSKYLTHHYQTSTTDVEPKTNSPKVDSSSSKPAMSPIKTVQTTIQKVKTSPPVPTTEHTTFTSRKQVKTKLGIITPGPGEDIDDPNMNIMGAPGNGDTNTETVFGFEDEKPTSSSYYIAVACISVVSVFSIAILVYLWYRKMRRQRGYEVSNIADQDLSNIVAGVNGLQTGSANGSVTLTDVPSIQIDKIDDDATIKSPVATAQRNE